jgi:hypothetical protein
MAGRASGQVIEVEVRGLAELERDWPVWERRTETELAGALDATATIARDVLRVRVPVKSGRFRASSRTQRIEAASPTVRLEEGAGVAYARWLEFGVRKSGTASRAGRYLVPTARRQKRNVKKQLAAATQREIERYPWPNPKP